MRDVLLLTAGQSKSTEEQTRFFSRWTVEKVLFELQDISIYTYICLFKTKLMVHTEAAEPHLTAQTPLVVFSSICDISQYHTSTFLDAGAPWRQGVPSQGSEGCCSPREHLPSSKGILREEDALSFPCYQWQYTDTAVFYPGCAKGCGCGGFQGFWCPTRCVRLRGRIGQAVMVRAVLCVRHVRVECSENHSHRGLKRASKSPLESCFPPRLTRASGFVCWLTENLLKVPCKPGRSLQP